MDYSTIFLSAKVALASTILLLLLMTPLTYLLAFARFPGKFLLESVVGLPLVLPPTVMGFYLLLFMGPEGPLGRLWRLFAEGPLVFTFAGVVLAAVLHGIPFAIQPLKAAFEKIDRRLLENAAVLGAGPVATFFRVVLPNATGGLAASAVLAFAHSMGEFGVILMVGGSIPGETRVASIAIYELVETLRYEEAWKLSLALVAISFAILVLFNGLAHGRRRK